MSCELTGSSNYPSSSYRGSLRVRAQFGQPFFLNFCSLLSKQKDMKLISFSVNSFTMLQVSKLLLL